MYPLLDECDLELRVKLFLTSTRPELKAVEVQAQGDTISLSGRVSSFHLRQLALEATKRVAGVKSVDDAIHVAWPALSR